LRYDTDLPLTKPGTDVLVHGHAHAPGGHPAPRVDVALRFSGRTKTLAVIGNRTWRSGVLGPSLSEPEPFVTLPITYERAYGGTDGDAWERRNPVGVGFATSANHLVGRPAPNIEDPSELITSWRQRPRPAGFGPIPRHWSPRLELAGTYDVRWEEERAPLLPTDLHEDFFYAAPVDQRVPGYLREGETIELLNLTPNGYLRVVLPKVRPTFRTFFGRESVEHHARLHTVIIEPEVPRVLLVWHTALRCHGKEHKLERTVVRMKKYV
jgi:hypothetical protein